jgi:hypothetical protein
MGSKRKIGLGVGRYMGHELALSTAVMWTVATGSGRNRMTLLGTT